MTETMTERERFEKKFPPETYGVVWGRLTEWYVDKSGVYSVEFNALWEGWQKAKAEQAAEVERLREALLSIRVYANDTLSGRANPDPKTYKDWLIAGIVELRNRSDKALSKSRSEDE